ncbi:endolytic transglycosylase MltG [soil metagenome]
MAKTKKSARQPKSRRWTYVLVVLMFLFVSFSYYFYQIFYTPNVDTKGQPAVLYIKTEADFAEVMDSIESKNIIIDRLSLRFIAKLMDYPELVKPGRYEIENGTTNYKLISKLRAGLQSPVKVTFHNVRLKKQLTEKLSSYIEADHREIDSLLSDPAYVRSLGFDTTTVMTMFVPNTYEVYWNTSGKELLDRLHKEYGKFWTKEREQKAEQLGLSKAEVSVLASIVEAESQKKDERPRIAGVYLNRLKRRQPLQADPTVVFAVQDFTIRRVLNVHLQTDSPYNTYKYAGLPPGPINLPSISSIDAVLNRENHDYFYFCAREDFSGYHAFARTHEEHIRNARRYQQALNERKILK